MFLLPGLGREFIVHYLFFSIFLHISSILLHISDILFLVPYGRKAQNFHKFYGVYNIEIEVGISSNPEDIFPNMTSLGVGG